MVRIRNPLVGIPKDELFADVETFANEAGLVEHLPLLRKGALAAQSPHAYDTIEDLDEEDRIALHTEATRRWHHPKALYLTIILNSIAAAIQGWDQTGAFLRSNPYAICVIDIVFQVPMVPICPSLNHSV